MKPIYFPFTFISEPVLKKTRLFFPQIIIYQPLSDKIPPFVKKSADEGLLEIFAPIGGDTERFETLLREYRTWIEQQKGTDWSFLKTKGFDNIDLETVPMFSDNSTSQIKYNIKKGPTEKTGQKPDDEFTARLFLLIAQEFDIQQYDFKRDLEHFQLMKKNLFTDIRGEDGFVESNINLLNEVVPDDPGSQKTAQRLSAWLKLFEKDPVVPDEFGSGLFITSSHAVLEYIMDLYPESEPVLSVGPIPVNGSNPVKIKEFQQALNGNLVKLSQNPYEKQLTPLPDLKATNKVVASLNIFCFPQISPWMLSKTFKKQPTLNSQDAGALNYQKTFIGIVE